jgi:hypothetical protein
VCVVRTKTLARLLRLRAFVILGPLVVLRASVVVQYQPAHHHHSSSSKPTAPRTETTIADNADRDDAACVLPGDAFPGWRAEQSEWGMLIGMQYNKVRDWCVCAYLNRSVQGQDPVCLYLYYVRACDECVVCACVLIIKTSADALTNQPTNQPANLPPTNQPNA